MKGEIVQYIFKPLKKDDWTIIKTNENVYSLRLGGYKKETAPIEIFDYEEIAFPYKNYQIQKVLTDQEWVYILLNKRAIIASGWESITYSGDMNLGVKFSDVDNYGDEFFDSGFLSELVTGNEGWSTEVKSL